MRIISLCPSNTEILYALDAGEHVIALDDHSDWPLEWQHLPKVGPDLTIDMNKVEALQPDLVIASLSVPGMEKNIEELKTRNLPYIILNPSHISDIAENIREVGRSINRIEKAEQVATHFTERIEQIRMLTKHVNDRPTLYWEWWPNPLYTPGRTNWLTNVSELAGATNVFADYNTDNVKTTRDQVAARNPDHIMVVWCGIEIKRIKSSMIKERPEWQQVTAIQKNDVHILEEGLYCRPSPRLLEGLEQLIKILHPSLGISLDKALLTTSSVPTEP
ncbi:cobalamin-binding protein [Brevibacterium sp. JNUCC-42]|nr:cobalamin-binding protein [Brevibacterium sp. JNUCC-42]